MEGSGELEKDWQSTRQPSKSVDQENSFNGQEEHQATTASKFSCREWLTSSLFTARDWMACKADSV